MSKRSPAEASVSPVRPALSGRVSGFGGLDCRQLLDSPNVTEGYGIGHGIYGCLTSAAAPKKEADRYLGAVDMVSLGDSLAIFVRKGEGLYLILRGGIRPGEIYLGALALSTDPPRSVSAFNYYSDPLDPVGGSYEKQLLIFPDAIRLRLTDGGWLAEPLASEDRPIPPIETACVHMSRLFGVGEDRIWVSAYNSPENFELDTASQSGEFGAWASTLQSNTRSDSPVSALTLCDEGLVCFKRNFCHGIKNTKNPFRITDLFGLGAQSAQAIAVTDGRVIFASGEGIYFWDGDTPRLISDCLGRVDYTEAALCAHGGICYIWLPISRRLYSYSTETDRFGAVAMPEVMTPMRLAATDSGAYMIDHGGYLWRIDSEEEGAFRFESGFFSLSSLRPWRVSRIWVRAAVGEGALLSVSVRPTGGEALQLGSVEGGFGEPRLYRFRADCVAAEAADCHSVIFEGQGRVEIFELTLEGEEMRAYI